MKSLTDILGPFPIIDQFPRPDWERVWEWVQKNVKEEEWESLFTQFAIEWLSEIKKVSDLKLEVYESDNFIFLLPEDKKAANRFAIFSEKALTVISEGLPDIARKTGYGKFVCINFSHFETYYDYISYFFTEGEFGATGGLFIEAGYRHFILNEHLSYELDKTLVHELTHALMKNCTLPLWLEEGVTQMMEDAVFGYSNNYYGISREGLESHINYWGQEGLYSFWIGDSFFCSDEGQGLSYSLALILTQNLLSRGRQKFLRLLQEVKFSDLGSSAILEIYGLELSDLAADFLGEGEWDYAPKTANDFFTRAFFFKRIHDLNSAIKDFDTATDLEPENTDVLNCYAWLLATHPNDEIRDGEKAVELATRACEASEWKVDIFLDTLGVAYAEQGDFEKAVEWAQKAIDIAKEGDACFEDFERLELFKKNEPFRESLDENS